MRYYVAEAPTYNWLLKADHNLPISAGVFTGQWQDGKVDQVRSRPAADFTGWESDTAKFEREFEQLVKALRTDEGREEPPWSRL